MLADALADWTWSDQAAYALGRTLGLFTDATFAQVKYVFWTDNDLGNGLHEALGALVHAGVLQQNPDEDDQYRWSPVAGSVAFKTT
ncbi:hypothetical protein [Catellatospora sp. IY07-71]|uniref:hypothetical protein n=1 Tax=Catellatospora sp. IY07-71 TaxID=2728827 RepID=UPI001BB3A0C9|nr:hypothetical protein [Catellatospora sp. IY07-71]